MQGCLDAELKESYGGLFFVTRFLARQQALSTTSGPFPRASQVLAVATGFLQTAPFQG